ncbi:hypothetical protein AQUCO_03400120v1 [Aquilegia coerulea]|uniref:Cyclin-dependent kinase inhibitor domain-containing protein n=1 Tax=Aquilegia coerulea TaxID=218851 RepID=A0A2G5CXL3_AQUCA|nr:hypothetical protein AQUCO_03400120v1 [Aquilegia coerulea]
MGKYMRKAKITGEVAVMELTQSSLGVRTRAKTLALQRLQQKSTPTTDSSSSSYLQLRSRRLEKKPPSLLGSNNTTNNDSKKNQETPKQTCNPNTNSNPSPISRTNSRLGVVGSVNSVSVGSEGGVLGKERGIMVENEESLPDNFNDVGVEASFGENVLDFEGRERSTRETTPCSLIGGSDTVGTPGSTTRPTNSYATNRRIQNAVRRNIPTTQEMEEFFAGAEQQQQRIFAEKYNFDPVNDSPLPGRYEWERVDP